MDESNHKYKLLNRKTVDLIHDMSLFYQAILAHLVKCIAGEVAVVRDVEAGEGGARRHLSRTISVTGSTAKDTIVAGRDGGRDYTEINSIPPLPLYSLMLADLDTSYKGAEEASKGAKVADGEGAQKSTEDQYSDLFQVGTEAVGVVLSGLIKF